MNVHATAPSPKARPTSATPHLVGDRVVIEHQSVSHVAAVVWTHADGRRSVTEIADAMRRRLGEPVAESTVWTALDELADAGLLMQRTTPPAGLLAHRTRREFLRTTAAAAIVAMMFPHRGEAEESPLAPGSDIAPPPLDAAGASAPGQDAAKDTAEDAAEQAKEAYRKRSAAERDAEQRVKAKRSESFENAPARVAPRDRSPEHTSSADGAAGPGASATPDLGDTGRSNAGSPGEIDQRYYQEHDLKRTQERNLKRQP